MSELDDKIEKLKAKVQAAQAQRYKAEAAEEVAKRNEAEYMQVLKDRFGLDDLGSARGKLSELEAELASKVAQTTAILDAHNF